MKTAQGSEKPVLQSTISVLISKDSQIEAPEQKSEFKSYYERRIIDELGVSPEINCIQLIRRGGGQFQCPVFKEDANGNIIISCYTLGRKQIEYDHPKATPEMSNIYNDRSLVYEIIRYAKPVTGNDGKSIKYRIPKGAGTYPFMSPSIVEKYERKEKIKTLVLTEGYFKAFKGCMHGINVIGLSSITHYKEKRTQRMYADVEEIIKGCEVENVVILYDGDCLDISASALIKEKDLSLRPRTFMESLIKTTDLLKPLGVNVYFAHINSGSLANSPKGLDDLLVTEKGREEYIANELNSINASSIHFTFLNISVSYSGLPRHFKLDNVDIFYDSHRDIIQDKAFVFKGSLCRYDAKADKVNIVRKKEALDFMRVGDDYYENLNIPNQYGKLEKRIVLRQKRTIIDDHGKEFLNQVPKYKDFCHIPSHLAFEQVSALCYNKYFPLEYAPEAGDCQTILMFLQHIFQEQYEYGLDYLQLLYKSPTQKLPVLCLVSKENTTGKTTFGNLLCSIFSYNAIIMGNVGIATDFNTHYIDKLLVIVDESHIEDKTKEMIKCLSTSQQIPRNAKFKDQHTTVFIGKMVLISNDEEGFIQIDNDDERFWVRKVSKPKKVNVCILEEMTDEIPAFLSFLTERAMKQNKAASRLWFEIKELHTAAKDKVICNSQCPLEKEIRYHIEEKFITSGKDELRYTCTDIKQEFFKGSRYSVYDISRVLIQQIKVEQYKNSAGVKVVKRYESSVSKPNSKESTNSDKESPEKSGGRPYFFYRKDFVADDK